MAFLERAVSGVRTSDVVHLTCEKQNRRDQTHVFCWFVPRDFAEHPFVLQRQGVMLCHEHLSAINLQTKQHHHTYASVSSLVVEFCMSCVCVS